MFTWSGLFLVAQKCPEAALHRHTAVIRTKMLHAYGFDSVRILLSRSEAQQKQGQLPRKSDPKGS